MQVPQAELDAAYAPDDYEQVQRDLAENFSPAGAWIEDEEYLEWLENLFADDSGPNVEPDAPEDAPPF